MESDLRPHTCPSDRQLKYCCSQGQCGWLKVSLIRISVLEYMSVAIGDGANAAQASVQKVDHASDQREKPVMDCIYLTGVT